ncbi:MAG: FkbM family methyltransferase [Pseudomonadota bacterium]
MSAYSDDWAAIEAEIEAKDYQSYAVSWGEQREKFFGERGARNVSAEDQARLTELREKYSGNRIFILGNGPSLGKTPLHLLKDEFTFGVNRIYLMSPMLGWKPTFYTALDWRVVPDNAAEINALSGSTFFFDERFRGLLREGPDVYFYSHGNFGRNKHSPISDDIAKGVAGAGSVVGTAVQLAAYMGFDPIYLLGCDLGYKVLPSVEQRGEDVFGTGVKLQLTSTQNDDPNHFDPRYFGKNKRWHDPNVARMIAGHEQCLEGLSSRGKRIYNATVGGELEVYPRRNIWTVLGSSPPRTFDRSQHASINEAHVAHKYFQRFEGSDESRFMIDVGAHHGTCCKPFAEEGWDVYCFEPDEANRKFLLRNTSGMTNVAIDSRAVSNESSKSSPFFRSEQSSGISGLLRFHDTHESDNNVDVTTLSEVFWDSDRKVDFLKIDVEGFDLNVLQGVPWDRMTPSVVLCEFEDAKTELLGHDYLDIADFLVMKGYTVYLSEWHPVLRYGVKHDWLGVKRYPCRVESKESWGNLLGFRNDPGSNEVFALFSECASTQSDDVPRSPASSLPEVVDEESQSEGANPEAASTRRTVANAADKPFLQTSSADCGSGQRIGGLIQWSLRVARRYLLGTLLLSTTGIVLFTLATVLKGTAQSAAFGFLGAFVLGCVFLVVLGYIRHHMRSLLQSFVDLQGRLASVAARHDAFESQIKKVASQVREVSERTASFEEALVNGGSLPSGGGSDLSMSLPEVSREDGWEDIDQGREASPEAPNVRSMGSADLPVRLAELLAEYDRRLLELKAQIRSANEGLDSFRELMEARQEEYLSFAESIRRDLGDTTSVAELEALTGEAEENKRSIYEANASLQRLEFDLRTDLASLREGWEEVELSKRIDNSPGSGFQLFNRHLSEQIVERIVSDWAPKLELTLSQNELQYMAHRIRTLESICLGRIATTIENAVIRSVIALSLGRERVRVLEIGTLFGLGAIALYDALVGKARSIHLTLIDPLSGYYRLQEADHMTGESVSYSTLSRNLTLASIPPTDYQIIQGRSEEAEVLSTISEQSFDLILIDGDHSREGVKRDFENYVGHLKPGGLLLFDDYGVPEWADITEYVDSEVIGDSRVEFIAAGFRTALFRSRMYAK